MSRRAFLIVALFAGSLAAISEAPPAWAQRFPTMLLIFAPDPENKAVMTQYDRLKESRELEAAGVDVVYVIGDGQVKLPPDDRREEAANLRKRYHVDANAFRIVLVGREGSEKARWLEPMDPHLLTLRARELPRQREPLPAK